MYIVWFFCFSISSPNSRFLCFCVFFFLFFCTGKIYVNPKVILYQKKYYKKSQSHDENAQKSFYLYSWRPFVQWIFYSILLAAGSWFTAFDVLLIFLTKERKKQHTHVILCTSFRNCFAFGHCGGISYVIKSRVAAHVLHHYKCWKKKWPNTIKWISSHESIQIEDRRHISGFTDKNQFDRQFYGCKDH